MRHPSIKSLQPAPVFTGPVPGAGTGGRRAEGRRLERQGRGWEKFAQPGPGRERRVQPETGPEDQRPGTVGGRAQIAVAAL